MKKIVFFLTILFSIMIVGCQNNPDQRESVEDQNQITEVKQRTEDEVNNEKDSQDIARHLVEIASAVPDVNDATAIVAGNYAVVGIDVNSELDRSRVGTVKYTVTEALKNDPYGANSVVTADADLVERIREMGKKINQGQPIAGIMNELAAIVNRIMPEAPADLFETTEDEPTEESDQQLNKRNEQELHNIQEKQDLDR